MQKEKISDNQEYQGQAFVFSSLTYASLLLLLFYFKLYYQPPEELDGVELNYGIDLVGSGDIQTTNLANDSPNNYDVKPAETSKEEIKVEKKTAIASTPKVVETKHLSSEVGEEKVIERKKENNPVTKKNNTNIPTKEIKEVKKNISETAGTDKAKNIEKGSLMKKSTGISGSNSNGTIGTRDGIGGNNNGDGAKGEVGDKGDPRGTLDGKSMMGKPGNGSGGTGASIGGLSGWKKKRLSLPNDGSTETGKLIFKVTVDDSGDVVGISVISSTVSPKVQNFYKNYIQQRLSSVLSPEGTPPDRATGTITINIESEN